MREMFAYVRFRDDNKEVALPVSDTKNFNPTGLNDYGELKVARFWDVKQCGYSFTQIVKLFGKYVFLIKPAVRAIVPISKIILKLL